MEAKEYIISAIKDLVARFENIHARYEYDNLAVVHTVEILPIETYKEDQAYIQWENDTMDRFIEQFPYENLCFVSEDAFAGIEHSEYEAEGIRYSEPTRVECEPICINAYGVNVSVSANHITLCQPAHECVDMEVTSYNEEDYSFAA